MDILSVKFEDCHNIVLTINWVAATLFALFVIIISCIIKWLWQKLALKTIKIEEATIGIGNSSVTIKYDGRIKEIAYKIWVELTTRKIGIKFDEDNDVINEVYDSWYEAFKVIRSLLEEVPAERIHDAQGLIELTTKVLNRGLRPHLTVWQARFRGWYANAVNEKTNLSPQELQKEFPNYESLVNDLKKTNGIMIKYADAIKRIIDSN